MNDVEENDVEERTEIILDQANHIFNRLENNIFSLKSRVLSFFAILVATVSFQVTLLQIVHSLIGNTLSLWYYLLLTIIFLAPMIYSGVLLFKMFWSTEYLDVEVFEDDRKTELFSFDKQALLSDFLYQLETSYKHNYSKHSEEIKFFKNSIISFIVGNSLFIIIIFVLFICKTCELM